VVITTAPGEEAQVDYGEGPMVRNRETGKYRRTRLFALRSDTAASRAADRRAVLDTDLGGAARAGFRRLAAACVVVLDNLREGVIVRIHTTRQSIRSIATCWHTMRRALPCRVRDPNRKARSSPAWASAEDTAARPAF